MPLNVTFSIVNEFKSSHIHIIHGHTLACSTIEHWNDG